MLGAENRHRCQESGRLQSALELLTAEASLHFPEAVLTQFSPLPQGLLCGASQCLPSLRPAPPLSGELHRLVASVVVVVVFFGFFQTGFCKGNFYSPDVIVSKA